MWRRVSVTNCDVMLHRNDGKFMTGTVPFSYSSKIETEQLMYTYLLYIVYICGITS